MQRCAVCAIARDEGAYIDEWVAYHLGLGFDHIVVYDNDSADDGMRNILTNRKVTVISWPDVPNQQAQNTAYGDFFEKFSSAYDWAVYIDIDEFINLKDRECIQDFVAAYEGCDGIAINWRMFGSSGHADYSDQPVLARFTQASIASFGPNAHVKTLFRPDAIERPYVHSPLFKPNKILVDCRGRRLDGRNADIINHDIDISIAQINHYFTKSQAEFTSKVRRGKADHAQDSPGRYRTLDEFVPYDRNEEEDTSILRLLKS